VLYLYPKREEPRLPLKHKEGMATSFEEKRSFPRIRLRIPIHCKVRGEGECSNAVSDNIGLGGIGFINDKFIAPQTFLMLEVNVLSRLLSPIGRIAWANSLPHSNRYQLGVEFIEFDPQEKNFLKDYIDIQTGKF